MKLITNLFFFSVLGFGQFYGIPPGVRSGTEANIPTACNQGEQYWANDSPAGLNLFFCTTTGATGVWSRVTSVGGGGGGTGYQPNQTLTGCGVEYITALTFQVGICKYTIFGVTYTSALSSQTLSTADPTNPRIDVIGVDNTGAVFVSAGTPAASPQQPTIDPATQLGLTFVYVAAGATTPTGITLVDIYEENTEWTSAVTANFNAASTSNPYRGTKDIEATTAVLTNSVTLTKPAAGTENLTNWNTLVFYIRSKAQWPNGGGGGNAARVVNIFWLSGSTQVGVPVVLRDGVFGFSSSTTGVYQQVSIPVSLFGTGSSTVTTLKFQIAGNAGSTSIGFYLDAITLQGGTGSIILPATLMNFKGTWSSSSAYVVNDTVVSGGVGYVALLANTNVAVSTASTWAPLGIASPIPVANGGTGLTSAFTRTAFITAAECNNATAAPAYDLPTSNAPTATCFGTSYRFGALAYDDAANETATFFVPLPTGWTGNIDFTGYAFVNATSQSVKLTVATICIATSEDILNPSFNSAQTITVTTPGTANQLFTFSQAAMTTTGCAAGETLVVKVGRDVTDTSTATFNYTGSQLVIRVTPQA